jgi:hypothetical protein
MALELRKDSDFYIRVMNVIQAMEENDVRIEYIADEFRISDMSDDAPECRQNMVLYDGENNPVQVLPSDFDTEYKLKVFNS